MGQPILEVEHLKKSYVNNVPILDDVSFSMQKGEVVVRRTFRMWKKYFPAMYQPSGSNRQRCVETQWRKLRE